MVQQDRQQRRRYRTLMTDSAVWDRFDLRAGDIVISTPPKCGTTWMQMLCALLVLDTADFYRPLSDISPWLDMTTYDPGTRIAELEAQEHRRFVKTHTPLDGLPFDPRVTYVCVGRDPRDALLSLGYAGGNVAPQVFADATRAAGVDPGQVELPPENPADRFWPWVDGPFTPEDPADFGVTLANFVHHVRTFWERRDEPQVALFHYADLRADLVGQVRRLAAALGIEVGDERLAELTAAATFDAMRARAEELTPEGHKGFWLDNRAFFHSGTSGKWRDVLDKAAIRRYEERLAELAPPDLATWLHTGWLGSSPAAG